MCRGAQTEDEVNSDLKIPGHQTRSNLVFTGVSPQVLDLPYLVPFTAGHILHLIKGFLQNKIVQVVWTDGPVAWIGAHFGSM
jgi:hypothetical protein